MKGPGLLLCKPTPEPRASGKAMRRRDFIKAVESSAVACPLPARAQQADRVRRVGVLMNRAASDPQGQARVEAFKQGLQQLGWSEGRNVQIDVGWGEDDADLEQKSAAQLIAPPDIIFASGTLSVAALRRLNRTVPIVFANVTDPDSRSMAWLRRGRLQCAGRSRHRTLPHHHAHEVMNDGSDRAQLANIASRAKEILGADELQAVAALRPAACARSSGN